MKTKDIVVFDRNQFTVQHGKVHGELTLISEASDLWNRHNQQLYDDACDVGFKTLHPLTGEPITFVMNHVEYDDEHELLYWTYELTPETIREHPEYAGKVKATVFND
jgi:hypothetical protein